MKMIQNPRAAWKHYSTIALSGIATVTGAYLALPADVQALVPYGNKAVLVGALITAVIGTAGKFIDQTSKDAP